MNYTTTTPVVAPPTVLIFNINETVHQYGEPLYANGIDLELLFNEMIKLMRFKSKCPEIFTLLAQGTIDKSGPFTAEEAAAVQQAVVAIGEAIWRKLVSHGVYGTEYIGQYHVLRLTFGNDLVMVRDIIYREPAIAASFDVAVREKDMTDEEEEPAYDADLIPF